MKQMNYQTVGVAGAMGALVAAYQNGAYNSFRIFGSGMPVNSLVGGFAQAALSNVVFQAVLPDITKIEVEKLLTNPSYITANLLPAEAALPLVVSGAGAGLLSSQLIIPPQPSYVAEAVKGSLINAGAYYLTLGQTIRQDETAIEAWALANWQEL